jgi:hypothetical protein
MRSRLEATVAEWLDAQGLVWKYEGPAYGNQDGQYLPDFQISGLLIEGVPHALYFDVKPPGKEREEPGLIGRTLNKMERILATDPAARLMVVGAHEDPYVMPMRWREGADRVFANGIWVRCEECGFIGVEDFYQWDRMFWLAHEAWLCPTCDHRGFDPISPWVSPQYRRYQELTGQSEEPW